MKKFKISLMAIFAVIIATIASSFTIPVVKTAMRTETEDPWFTYTLNSQALSDLQNNANYTYDTGAPGCSGNEDVCAIQAPGVASSGQHPTSFSSPLLTKIENVADRLDTYPEIAQQGE